MRESDFPIAMENGVGEQSWENRPVIGLTIRTSLRGSLLTPVPFKASASEKRSKKARTMEVHRSGWCGGRGPYYWLFGLFMTGRFHSSTSAAEDSAPGLFSLPAILNGKRLYSTRSCA